MINYSGWFDATATTASARIEYKGCPVGLVHSGASAAPDFAVRGFAVEVSSAGPHALEARNIQRGLPASLPGTGPITHDLGKPIRNEAGLYLSRLLTPSGRLIRRILLENQGTIRHGGQAQ